MSERKVPSKYYPPDFDPSILQKRNRSKRDDGPMRQTVRIMAPFTMQCLSCSEFVYKGRKFNSRKVTNREERYLGIQIHTFHIKCTRCSAEIVVRTDPKNNDYAVVSGAKRLNEPWRKRDEADETDEQRLDRLEREEAEAAAAEDRDNNAGLGRDAMADLEAQDEHARREMAVADALDQRRQRNARIERAEREGVGLVDSEAEARREAKEREDMEFDDMATAMFRAKRAQFLEEKALEQEAVVVEEEMVAPAKPPASKSSWTIKRPKKKDYAAMAGFKIKKST